ncbi:MAG: hydroxyethylthiazole kinase, partial [Oligosphaeraceae bacterium]|nr:hydroxyethylthiazole kinase [Oligosphaeraceae bacterium]
MEKTFLNFTALQQCWDNLSRCQPLVHCITNYVTVNDVANILLACNASPIMSAEPREVEEIVALAQGLLINVGVLTSETIPAMFLAGKKANALGVPVVMDPVGAGATKLRTDTTTELLDEVRFAVIRGNISEIKALALGGSSTRGVDAALDDAVTSNNLSAVCSFARDFARSCNSVIVITGAIDLVTDAQQTFILRNGHPMMSRITGSGCQLTALIAALVAANPSQPLLATAAAVAAMGIAGELAFDKNQQFGGGNSSYRNHLIDAIFN